MSARAESLRRALARAQASGDRERARRLSAALWHEEGRDADAVLRRGRAKAFAAGQADAFGMVSVSKALEWADR